MDLLKKNIILMSNIIVILAKEFVLLWKNTIQTVIKKNLKYLKNFMKAKNCSKLEKDKILSQAKIVI